MIILFNGCSHTHGSKISPLHTWANMVCKSLLRDSKFLHINSSLTDTQIIYNYLDDIENTIQDDVDYGISIAKSGKSNDAIFFETIEAIEKLKNINKKPSFVFIQWSGPNRRIHTHFDERISYVNPSDNPHYGLVFEPYASEITITLMKAMQTYLKFNNIDYIFIPYMEFDDTFKYKNTETYKSLDFSKIVTIDNEIGKIITKFKNKNLTIDKQGHPTILGHWVIAGKVIDKLGFYDNLIGFFDFMKLVDKFVNGCIFLNDTKIEHEGMVYDETYLKKIKIIDSEFKIGSLISSYKEPGKKRKKLI